MANLVSNHLHCGGDMPRETTDGELTCRVVFVGRHRHGDTHGILEGFNGFTALALWWWDDVVG